MTIARPLPRTGSVHLDARGADRSLRVSWHQEAQAVVLSLWRDNVCTGTFRLVVDEVPDVIAVLRAGLEESYAAARGAGSSVSSARTPPPTPVDPPPHALDAGRPLGVSAHI